MNGYLRWRDRIGAVMDPALYTLEWLDGRVEDGSAHVFHTDDAVIVVELRDYPTGAKDVHGLVAAGDLASIIHILIPAAESFGRSNGAVGALIESRPGWARALHSHGYAPYQLSVRKVL